jgi:hypothetical protein
VTPPTTIANDRKSTVPAVAVTGGCFIGWFRRKDDFLHGNEVKNEWRQISYGFLPLAGP